MFHTEDLMAHMRSVLAAERDLRDLAVVWQTVEASAAIGCPDEAGAILETLVETRRRFDELQGVLIEQMVLENRAELGDDLGAKAQCAIDILVRNLYERTADIGFLATDDGVRSFCAAAPAERAATRDATVRRLAEYQAKYSVYDDVILLSPRGEILARLADANGLAASSDRLVADVLAARDYVERFGPTDLASGPGAALLYARTVHGAGGQAVGVLVLRFRFADEMRRIFADVVDDPTRMVVTLVDDAGSVIASSDEAHIPLGSRLPPLRGAQVELTAFAGREYMARSCASHGYQGYAGPGWRAIAMVSLLTAFRHRNDVAETDVPLDNAQLKAVHGEADAINRELRRVLWNGRLQIGAGGPQGSRLKAVLRQVAVTGARTRQRVTRAIQDIYSVALARSRHQTRELARLAADVMDRNLYERANDCRWWALSPVLQRGLAEPASPANSAAMQAVLEHINGLYTVYSQLVVFDTGGVVRAVSVADTAERWVGQSVPAAWVRQVQGLNSSQAYAVTPFEDTELHAHGATYVYLAAVHEASGSGRLGGVAIVFNAARELGAILRDILGERAGVAAFLDADGRVLAATDGALADSAARALVGDAAVIEHAGAHYACARIVARGYREFKAGDGYDNGVSALIALRLGASERPHLNFSDFDLATATPCNPRDGHADVAIFQVAAMRLALPVSAVLDAISPQALVRTPSVRGAVLGMAEVSTGASSRLVRVLCARQLLGVSHSPRQNDGVLLILRPPGGGERPLIGLHVDDVLAVLEVQPAHVHDAPAGVQQFAPWVASLIDCQVAGGPDGVEKVLVQLLSHERLWHDLSHEAAPAVAVTEGLRPP